jgi:ParB family chromosome partitioning protein
MTMSVVTSVSTVGSKKLPPCAARFAAQDDLGALLDGVGNVRLDLLDRLHVDQRPDHRARLEAVGDLHRAGGLGEALGKGVIDAVPHQDAVGADAGLAGIAVFRGDRVLDRHLDVGVVKDDERRVAAEVQRHLLERRRTAPHPVSTLTCATQ